jgi:hypothetical protein
MKPLYKQFILHSLLTSLSLLFFIPGVFAGGGMYVNYKPPEKLSSDTKMSTYAPAPFGSYNSIRLKPKPYPGRNCWPPGQVINVENEGLLYCKDLMWHSFRENPAWEKDPTGMLIYPVTTPGANQRRVGIKHMRSKNVYGDPTNHPCKHFCKRSP